MDGKLSMQGGTPQQHCSGHPGAKGPSLRVSGGTTVAEEAVLGHVVHWLDLLAISRHCDSGGELLRFVWGRQEVLADRLCGIPKNQAPQGSEQHRGQVGLEQTRQMGGSSDASDERCSSGTCYSLDGKRRDAQAGQLIRPAPRSPCHAALVGPYSGRPRSSRPPSKMKTVQRAMTKGAPKGRRESYTDQGIWTWRTPSIMPSGSRNVEREGCRAMPSGQ